MFRARLWSLGFRSDTERYVRQTSEQAEVKLDSDKKTYHLCRWSTGGCKGITSDVPVGFGKIVVCLKFMVIEFVSYNLIIGTPALVRIRARIDMNSQTVQVRKDGKSEVLNLVYKPEMLDDTDDDMTTDTESETDAGDFSEKDEFSGFVMILDATKESENELEEAELVRQKVEQLRREYAAEVKHRFESYPDVIAYSFDDVRPSKCKVKHKFELTSDQPIFQRLKGLLPNNNETVKKEVERMLNAGIISPVESQLTSPIVSVTKKDGSIRFCVESRGFNAVMTRDRWPVPRVDKIFNEVQGSRLFTTIDLFEGYRQIKIEESCKEMKTFIIIRHIREKP